MAIYHLSVRGLTLADGSSAVRSSAYQSGQRMTVARTGEVADYGRKERVSAAGVVAPDGAPAWATDRQRLWDSAEAECRGSERVARRIEFAIPRELDRDLALASVADLCSREASRGRACDWAVHDLGGSNPHAHVLVSELPLGRDGFVRPAKPRAQKTYLVRRGDEERWVPSVEWKSAKREGWEKVYRWRGADGAEVRLTRAEAEDGRGMTLDDRVSKSPVSSSVAPGGDRRIDRERADLKALREAWETIANSYLAQQAERDGSAPIHVDCRSYADRGIDRVATVHEGPSVTAIESREGGDAPATRVRAENLRREAVNLAADAVETVSSKVAEAAEWTAQAEDAQRDADAERARAGRARADADRAVTEATQRAQEADRRAKESEGRAKAAQGRVDALVDSERSARQALDAARKDKSKADSEAALRRQEAQAWRRSADLAKAEAKDANAETDEAKRKAGAHLAALGVTREGLLGVLRDLAWQVACRVVDAWDEARDWARDLWSGWVDGWGVDTAAALGVGESEHRRVSREEMAQVCEDAGAPEVMADLYPDEPAYGDEGAR